MDACGDIGSRLHDRQVGICHGQLMLPPILRRLSIDPDAWTGAMQPSGNVFGRALGRLDILRLHASTLGQQWIRNLRAAERLFVK